MPALKYRVRSRTIEWPTETSERVKVAAKHLGISGERLIQLAIAEKVQSVYGEIYLEAHND